MMALGSRHGAVQALVHVPLAEAAQIEFESKNEAKL
jgi:hypothetical protein